MVFTKFVEIGRVAMINYGDDYGKLCTVVNVINGNLALVDGPQNVTGVHRQKINFKRLTLTGIKVKIPLNARQKTIAKAFEAEEVLAAWEKSSLKRKLNKREKRASLNDFDRFKVMLARKEKSKLIRKELAKLRK
jgi:large subunit ribosomal protein L14e